MSQLQKVIEEKITEFVEALSPDKPENFGPLCGVIERLSMSYPILTQSLRGGVAQDDES